MPVELHVQRFGSGPPLLVAHGLFGSGTNWRTLGRALSSEWDVLLVDARNHGRSPHVDTMSYADMSADLIRVLDDASLESAHFLGHSMGGKTAMVTALCTPERVRSLAVADIAPVSYTHRFGAELQSMQDLDLAIVQRRSDADEQMARHIDDPMLRSFLLQNLQVSPSASSWRLNLSAIAAAESELTGFPDLHCAPYTGPTTLITGERSAYVTAAHNQTIKQLFPNAEFSEVADAGHWLHAEKPEQFLDTLRVHLARSNTHAS